MSCPHSTIFSCEVCIQDSLRRDIANNPTKGIFERFRELKTERDELLELVRACSISRTTDESWAISEICYDYLARKGKNNG